MRRFIIIVAALGLLTGCTGLITQTLRDLTNPFAGFQLAQKSRLLSKGDDEDKVIRVLGEPQKKSSFGPREAWQYCATGHNFVTVWLRKGEVKLVESKSKKPRDIFCVSDMPNIDWNEIPTAVEE